MRVWAQRDLREHKDERRKRHVLHKDVASHQVTSQTCIPPAPESGSSPRCCTHGGHPHPLTSCRPTLLLVSAGASTSTGFWAAGGRSKRGRTSSHRRHALHSLGSTPNALSRWGADMYALVSRSRRACGYKCISTCLWILCIYIYIYTHIHIDIQT